jgi:hypothetical protein
MDDIKAKQQLLEKIKESTNILVTVSNDPTVDALSAAIGLTLLLDKMDKHATAVFSGVVPPAIAFLEPEKILDDTTDSLRDFIIALDKEKADHLRYKVEGDSVKIFITPYKTTITSDDLQFSQGDYNVELVVALGVDDQDHLDSALESHGQILHDATVATITAGEQTSTLGGIDWHDDQASSLSEMLAGLSEALKTDKNKSLIDAEIATAYLTGIVAQTERFSNRNTTSKVMTVASQLMAAGADQQLVATKLDEASTTSEIDDEPEDIVEAPVENDDKDVVEADGTLKIGKHKDGPAKEEEEAPVVSDESETEILTTPQPAFETLEELDRRVKAEEQAEAVEQAEAALHHVEKAEQNTYLGETNPGAAVAPIDTSDEPLLGGTLNATTDQAEEDARREEANDQNKTILQHSYLQPSDPSVPDQSPGSQGVSSIEPSESAYVPSDAPVAPVPEPAPIAPPVPAGPVDLGLPMPPPVPDFSQGVPPLAGPYAPPSEQPAILGDILAPEPSQPVVPPAPVLPPTPEAPIIPSPPIDPAGPYAPPAPSDPGQFKIPGQQ